MVWVEKMDVELNSILISKKYKSRVRVDVHIFDETPSNPTIRLMVIVDRNLETNKIAHDSIQISITSLWNRHVEFECPVASTKLPSRLYIASFLQ